MAQRPGYLLVVGNATDREGMDAYQAQLPPIYKAYGGYRLVMGGESGEVTFLSGDLDTFSVMLARFPSPESVSDFWWSKEYREAYRARKSAGRFSAAAVPGLDQDSGIYEGGRGYLAVVASPQRPGQWRRFADAMTQALESKGATILIDIGPEAIERLESRLPGSHVLIAMLANGDSPDTTWSALEDEMADLQADVQPVTIIAMDGLASDHPERLTP